MRDLDPNPLPRSEAPSGDAATSSLPASAPHSIVNPLSVPDKSRPPSSKLLPPDVLALVIDESNLSGADHDDDSDAGDRALPLELLDQIHLPDADVAANDSLSIPPERQRLWDRLDENTALRQKILNYLIRRHLIPNADAEDIVNDTYARVLHAKKWPTDEKKSLYGWLRKFANFTRLRHQRESERREGRELADEQIEERAAPDPDANDHDEKLRAADHVAAQKPEFAQARAIMEKRAATGRPIRELAVAEGISPETAQKRIQRYSEAVRRYAVLGGSVSIAVGLLLLALSVPGEPLVTRPYPRNVTLPELPAATAPELRARGLAQCERRKYEVCVKLLDRAKELDPGGESDPRVVKARGEAEKVLHAPTRP